jgi:hypothetical protein
MDLRDDGDVVKGLGFVALHSAYLEEAVEDCVATFVEAGAIAPDKIFSVPTSKQVECLKQEVLQRGQLPTELVRFPDLLDHVLDLLKLRHELIHGRIYGGLGPNEGELRRGRRHNVTRKIRSEELYGLANRINKACSSLRGASMFSLQRFLHRNLNFSG